MVDALRYVDGRAPQVVVEGLVRNAIRMVAAPLDVLYDVLGGGLERIGIARLDRVEPLVRVPVRAHEEGREALLDGLCVAERGQREALRGGVRLAGVCVVGEGGVDGAERVGDEGDGGDAGEDGEVWRCCLGLGGHGSERRGRRRGRGGGEEKISNVGRGACFIAAALLACDSPSPRESRDAPGTVTWKSLGALVLTTAGRCLPLTSAVCSDSMHRSDQYHPPHSTVPADKLAELD